MSPEHKPMVYAVDDEKIIAFTIAQILNKNGYDARWFTDPYAALEAASSDEPELVLSDVAMPHMSGFELALRLGHANPHCKVMLISGQAMTSDLLRAARAHGHIYDVLPKPIHPDALLEAIGIKLQFQPRDGVLMKEIRGSRDRNGDLKANLSWK